MRVAIVCTVATALLAATAGPASGVSAPAGSGGVTAGAGASLKLTDTSPVVVRGSGFHRRERVRVRLQGGGTTALHKLRASRSGTFRTTFRSADLSRPCSVFLIRATGLRGSEATVTRHPLPDCAPE
jgi:hypothetical protein